VAIVNAEVATLRDAVRVTIQNEAQDVPRECCTDETGFGCPSGYTYTAGNMTFISTGDSCYNVCTNEAGVPGNGTFPVCAPTTNTRAPTPPPVSPKTMNCCAVAGAGCPAGYTYQPGNVTVLGETCAYNCFNAGGSDSDGITPCPSVAPTTATPTSNKSKLVASFLWMVLLLSLG